MRAGDESFERLRRAIEELAGGDGAELVAEARVEARARVRSMLTEAMAQTMLERAREELERQHRRPPHPSRPPEAEPRAAPPPPQPLPPSAGPPASPAPAAMQLGWYVYCVVAADGTAPPADVPGVDPGHAVTLLSDGALAAVVSQVALEDFGEDRLREQLADMDWLERTARTHEEVLDTVRGQRTLIPMRLCSIYRTEAGVLEMLRREADALVEALEHLKGKTEWGVKVFANGDGVKQFVAEELGAPTESDAAGAGAAYMQRQRLERREQERAGGLLVEACERIHERLRSVSADGLTSPPQRPEVTDHAGQMILNGVYLVQDGAQEDFHEEVRALQAEFAPLGLELEPTGPWPAYNFVPGTIGAAW
jgi:Gas vesicle synthesis protein GvpL/GvpF